MVTITEDFREKVRKAARSVASGVNQVEAEDVEQDIWVRLLEDVKYYDELCDVEDPFKALKRIGKQEAYKQSSAYEHFSGQYIYAPNEVRGLLSEYLLDVELETIAEHVDLTEGLLLLKAEAPSYFSTLIGKWVRGEDPHRQMVDKAVVKLCSLMNQVSRAMRYSYEGPGSRRAMSNSQAQARKENNWS